MGATLTAPGRSLDQRRQALKKANRIRSERKDLKMEMKHDRSVLVPLIEQPPAFIETMKVFDLLIAAPKIGRVKAGRLLRAAQISPSKTVSGLSDRQRTELLALLGGGR